MVKTISIDVHAYETFFHRVMQGFYQQKMW